jgi:hypothetical protein
MLVPPLACVSNIEIWGSAKLPTGLGCPVLRQRGACGSRSPQIENR